MRLSPEVLDFSRAELLKGRARSSALAVFLLLSLYAVILTFMAPLLHIAIWAVAAAAMIGLTLLLPALYERRGLSFANARDYLFWHTAMAGATGLVWGLGAMWLADPDFDISIYSTGIMLLSLTLGGISPQSAYRRSYVALATCALLPYAGWISFTADWPLSAVGIGTLFAYVFFMSASARVEIATRDAIAVEHNRRLMETLARQHEALQKASEEKTRFLAATSHDLAQPLHAQGFFLAALRERTQDAAQIELLDKIEASWRGLGSLLDGLIDVSRLDAGAIVADFRHVDLTALAQRIADEFSAVAESKGVRLDIDVAPAAARTDPILFGRILRNLLSNAIKFTDAGGTVTLAVQPDGQQAKVKIADTGIGIPAGQQQAVFQEYVQLGNRERNREKGLGLGLSIVRRLTAMLDIETVLTSESGKGTSFVLTLPGAVVLQNANEKMPEQPLPDPRVDHICALIVDDEDAIRNGMSTVLSSWGCQVYAAESGDDAVRLLDRMDVMPNVLIVDQRLGAGETGMQVIERIRDELNDEIAAVMMTGDISADMSGGATGSVRILHKPVEPTLLCRVLCETSSAAAFNR